jgi:hypothetical protein
MSKEMIWRQSSDSPRLAAAMTPATGPDSIIVTGIFFAVSADIKPPLDCITRKVPRKPAAKHFGDAK